MTYNKFLGDLVIVIDFIVLFCIIFNLENTFLKKVIYVENNTYFIIFVVVW
jgi:hypothetical protein